MGDEKRPAYYNIYPVQPVEISRHLGFCLGNAVKYILRAPFKGTPEEDCQKALQYLGWEMSSPHESTPVYSLDEVQSAIQRLKEYLASEVGASELQNSHALYTQYFLKELESYVETGSSDHLKQMHNIIIRLKEILSQASS